MALPPEYEKPPPYSPQAPGKAETTYMYIWSHKYNVYK